MGEAYVRAFAAEDAEIVAANLRRDDRMEVAAHSGRTPYDAVVHGVLSSDIACTISSGDGNPVAVFGVCPGGCIWLLSTDALTKPPLRKQFIRECRKHIDILQARYPLLHNVIDARQTVHIRWLRHMGFTFIRRIPTFGVEQRPFLEFVRISNV